MQREHVPRGRSCPAPAAHTCRTDFLSTTASWKQDCPSLSWNYLETQLPPVRNYSCVWALVLTECFFCLDECINSQKCHTLRGAVHVCTPMGQYSLNSEWFHPVLSAAGQFLAGEEGPEKKVSRVWQVVCCSAFDSLAKNKLSRPV